MWIKANHPTGCVNQRLHPRQSQSHRWLECHGEIESLMYVISSNPLYDLSAHQLCTVGTMLWFISKSTLNTNDICSNFASACTLAIHELSRPEGVEFQEWKINGFKTELFHTPPRSIKFLYRLAQQERVYFMHSMHDQKGKPKHVRDIPNDDEMVGPLVAQAHRCIADAIELPALGTAKTLSRKQRYCD